MFCFGYAIRNKALNIINLDFFLIKEFMVSIYVMVKMA